ncbi:hypothetical protein [Volucribacter amazonae]|uniref:Uncharacterized protein n=1 Tax=Volucribacter amazonae TaxID=256731 RepID=A0A9X4PBU8_9PAST|nr:hypothetical protein [Volucribacter amazonae]MDG6894516.1 hypothetical protein [Volucribacter amazonae]
MLEFIDKCACKILNICFFIIVFFFLYFCGFVLWVMVKDSELFWTILKVAGLFLVALLIGLSTFSYWLQQKIKKDLSKPTDNGVKYIIIK